MLASVVDCEMAHSAWPAQPVNTASSLAFVVAGAKLLADVDPTHRPLGVTSILVGVGSVIFHGSAGNEALFHDWALFALASIVLVLIVRSVARRGLVATTRGLGVSVVLLAGGLVLFWLGRTGGPLCNPASLIQPHAGWHLLGAASVASLGTWLGPARALPS